MKKVLVVFYSRTGTSRQLATTLAELKAWAAGEIVDVQPGRGDWRCVLDSLLTRRPRIRYQGPPPEQFDTVVLVAPIWMYRLAGPMRSFVAQYRQCLRTVAVASSMGGRGAPNAVAEIAPAQQPRLLDPARVQAAPSTHPNPGRFIGTIGSKKPSRSTRRARQSRSSPAPSIAC